MPNYTFELLDGADSIDDRAGVNLPDRDNAFEYARNVARELMNCRELQTRHWRLDVYEDDAERIFEIPFDSVDRTLDHVAPEWRERIGDLCKRRLALAAVSNAARATVRESRALVARSRGRPYLAAAKGRKTIRD